MPNPYGWGQYEPQIKPKDQGGDTIATFSQKVYNLFDNLFDTLNSYPWSTATQSDAGYMSAADKTALDDVPTTYLPLSGGTMMGAIISNSVAALMRPNNTSQLTLIGGSSTAASAGAKFVLTGADYTDSGQFNLQAGNSNGYKQLIGKPDGTLIWDETDIFTVGNSPVSFSSSATRNYCAKFANGVMVQCYDGSLTTDSNSRVKFIFSEAFKELPFSASFVATPGRSLNIYSTKTTQIELRVNDMSGAIVGANVTVPMGVILIGRWK